MYYDGDALKEMLQGILQAMEFWKPIEAADAGESEERTTVAQSSEGRSSALAGATPKNALSKKKRKRESTADRRERRQRNMAGKAVDQLQLEVGADPLRDRSLLAMIATASGRNPSPDAAMCALLAADKLRRTRTAGEILVESVREFHLSFGVDGEWEGEAAIGAAAD